MEVIREITLLSSIYVVHESTVMMHLDTNIFLFFSFYFDNEEAHDCGHMTYHIM